MTPKRACSRTNTICCARRAISFKLGPKTLVIKRGEYGAMMVHDGGVFSRARRFRWKKCTIPPAPAIASPAASWAISPMPRSMNDAVMRRAMVYGSVMGSFAVERFGLERIRQLKRREIDARARHFFKLTQFQPALTKSQHSPRRARLPRRAPVYTRRLPIAAYANVYSNCGSDDRAVKPPALAPGGLVRVISPASPADRDALGRGIAELERLGYRVRTGSAMQPEGYFAGSTLRRKAELEAALQDPDASAVICARGGYGTAALLDQIRLPRRLRPKLLDRLQRRDHAAGISLDPLPLDFALRPYGRRRVRTMAQALAPDMISRHSSTLQRESATPGRSRSTAKPLSRGEASGLLLGGCITLLETTLGTPWEFDTRGAILFLEDRGVKPYQLDRMLLHLLQAGKFRGVRGIVLGDFPDSEPPRERRHRARRLPADSGPLRIPIIFGAPIGHTVRPMLTIPLGVRARLHAAGEGKLEILEPAVACAHEATK